MSVSGDWIRRLREQREFTREQVEELTQDFAKRTGNERNWIRHGRLAHIERGEAVPDVYTVQSFAEIYQIAYERVLQGFGIDISVSGRLLATSLMSPSEGNASGDSKSQTTGTSRRLADDTQLLTDRLDLAEVLRNVLGLEFDEVNTRIGLIGSKDHSMAPFIHAGSVIKIDTRQKTIETSAWRELVERPIYFFWHEKGFSCSWCDQTGNKLILLPHPGSHRPAMQLTMPGQVEVIGRVTHVWSCLPGIEVSK